MLLTRCGWITSAARLTARADENALPGLAEVFPPSRDVSPRARSAARSVGIQRRPELGFARLRGEFDDIRYRKARRVEVGSAARDLAQERLLQTHHRARERGGSSYCAMWYMKFATWLNVSSGSSPRVLAHNGDARACTGGEDFPPRLCLSVCIAQSMLLSSITERRRPSPPTPVGFPETNPRPGCTRR